MRNRLGWIALAALLAAGCDKAQLLAPTDSTIAVSAAARVVPLGGNTEVTAFVIEEAGTPVQNGTTVRFTTTLGTMSPVEVQTVNGLAVTTFVAGSTSGVAQVRAISGAATGGEGDSNLVEITVGAAAANAVAISASPSNLPASGGTAQITATVLDESGNPVPGVAVFFSSTAGSLSATTVTTDGNGRATAAVTTNRQAEVTARVGSGADARTATTTVGIGTPAGLSLSISPTSPTAGQPVTLTITPTVASGDPAPRITVTWGDGTQENLGAVASARTVAHTYSSPGSYTITVRGTVDGDTTTSSIGVNVVPRAAFGINITSSESTPQAETPVTFTAATTGDTSVSISSYQWRFFDSSGDQEGDTVTTSGNQVTHVFEDTGTKTITVTATATDGRTATGQTQVVVVP